MGRSRRKMLGVPVGFEIRIDFAVPGVPSATHARTGIEVGERAHRCAARPIAAGDGREIRFRELHDVVRKALAAEVMQSKRIPEK